MLYYEKKEKEILNILEMFQKDAISVNELKDFFDNTQNEIIKSESTVHKDDTENFLRCEKYWILLHNVLTNKIDKRLISTNINYIKAKDFIEEVRHKRKDIITKIEPIKKPILYFDNNIYIYLKQNIPITQIKNEFQFAYSPAHLEELANSIRQENFQFNDYIEKDLNYLSDLTNNVELLPDLQNGIIICSEFPGYPLERVIDGFDGTIISEQMEKEFLENRNDIKEELSFKIKGSTICGILKSPKAEELLNEKTWFKEYKNLSDKTAFWEKYKNNYDFLFQSITGLVNIIELFDNNPEPSRKYRSHLHDTTHLIYATKSDIFVTSDNRLFEKATELFDFLGVQTKILNYEDFSKYCLR